MPQVTVLPSGVTFDTEPPETVMAAARRCGFRWPTVCHQLGECGVCAMKVLSDASALSPMTEAERRTLALVQQLRGGEVGTYRLACVARAEADVVVQRRGVRPRDEHQG